jgi:intein/homing endonuclease
MPRLAEEEKRNIISAVRSGKSLCEIMHETKAGKTTVYYYLRKIRGKKFKSLSLKLDNLELVGEVIGFFAGDGRYAVTRNGWDRRILFYFNKREVPVINHYRDSVERLIGRQPTLMFRPAITIMQIHARVFCDFILDYVSFGKRKVKTITLRNKILLKNRSFVKGFLRGLVDSDGYVRKGRKEIYFGSISKKLVNDFIDGLNLLKFNYKIYTQTGRGYSDFYKVRLIDNDVDKFMSLVKPAKGL